MLKELLKQYDDYLILAEDAHTLQFTILINVITDEIEKMYQFYELDHTNKVIYLELKQNHDSIYIVTDDELELPITVVKNLNEAADFMRVTATHLYRADRNAGRPDQLNYNNYILIKNVI